MLADTVWCNVNTVRSMHVLCSEQTLKSRHTMKHTWCCQQHFGLITHLFWFWINLYVLHIWISCIIGKTLWHTHCYATTYGAITQNLKDCIFPLFLFLNHRGMKKVITWFFVRYKHDPVIFLFSIMLTVCMHYIRVFVVIVAVYLIAIKSHYSTQVNSQFILLANLSSKIKICSNSFFDSQMIGLRV